MGKTRAFWRFTERVRVRSRILSPSAFFAPEEIDEYRRVKETEIITPEEPESGKSVEDAAGRHADAPLSSSTEERAGERSRTRNPAACFAPEAREILNNLPEKYATDGKVQSTLPDMPKAPPISQLGNVAEIFGELGGAGQFRTAVNQLQSVLNAA